MNKLFYSLITVLLLPFALYAEDIDLYVGSDGGGGGSAQIMVIFDNSGSMSATVAAKSSYDPGTDYEDHRSGFYTNRATYFATGKIVDGASIPEPLSENGKGKPRRFNRENNACNQSRVPLYGVWQRDNIDGTPNPGGITKYGDEIEDDIPSGDSYDNYTLIEGGQGFFVDKIVMYKKDTWIQIKEDNGLNNNDVVDCRRDVSENDPLNSMAEIGSGANEKKLVDFPGFPVNNQKQGSNVTYHLDKNHSKYRNNRVSFRRINFTTLYTENYLNWYHSIGVNEEDQSRLQVAKKAIKDLITASSSDIEYGLTFFNRNYSSGGSNNDGGRVVNAVKPKGTTHADDIFSKIDAVTASTNTPLCETLYEVSRYFGGLSVVYGDDANSIGPSRDMSAESPAGTYSSPITPGCRDQVYIILMTDGAPTQDSQANSAVSSLPNADIGKRYTFASGGSTQTSYLPVLSHWMARNDINPSVVGRQTAITYTIGFGDVASQGTAGELLKQTAENSGGEYFPATDSVSLTNALHDTIIGILQTDSTFTSPAVASNNFDRTRSLDSVYFSMFYPESGPRWTGNIKKLKVVQGAIMNNNPTPTNAIDKEGNISTGSFTFWGGTDCGGGAKCADGNDVSKGGVAEMLTNKSVDTRSIYTDLGPSDSLVPMTLTTVKNASYSVGGSTKTFYEYLNTTETEQDHYIMWAQGIDVDDDDKDDVYTDTRIDVFADPLHSKPLIINYGGSESSPDIRILVGTNGGAVHLFHDQGDDTVDESWVFMPKDLFPNIRLLRDNTPGTPKVYGMDGSPIAWVSDKNNDGNIRSVDGDKVWAFIGMRRGGLDYYALDLSNPGQPKKMWQLKGGQGSFPELGQTWSQPVIGYVNMASRSDNSLPVLFISGGYNGDSDIGSSPTNPGRSLYIIEAKTGELLWKASSAANNETLKNTYAPFSHAMPSMPAILDSDTDGYIDRIYQVDVGGNIWRVDMPGNKPFSTSSPWTVYKLADLSGEDLVVPSTSQARKFFGQPSIVRTFFTQTKEVTIASETFITESEVPYDGVLIGSGDRANPNDAVTNDMFFMVQDRNVLTHSFEAPSTGHVPITETSLFDFSNDPLSNNTDAEFEANMLALGGTVGWKFDFSGLGEKSMSGARALFGVVYFASFLPGDSSGETCLAPGTGYLY